VSEWFGALPERWEVRRIKTLFSLRDERNFLPLSEVNLLSLYTAIGVKPHAQIERVAGNIAVTADNYKKVYKNDIVVNIILCWQGAVGVSKWDGVTSPAYDVYRVNTDNVNVDYYHYLFRIPHFSGECYRAGHGIMAMRWRTYSDEFSAIAVPLPPRSEQDQIVRYLDWKVSRINKLVNAKRQQVALLQEQKRTVINAAVTKGGEGWEYRRLKSLISDINEKSSPNGQFYIGMENVISWTGKYLNTGTSVEGDCKRFIAGDILFGKLRPYLAKVYLPENGGACSGEFLVLRGFTGDLLYLKYFLLSNNFIMLVNASTYGAKMPRANWDFIGNCIIPLPPLAEQRTIVDYLDEKCWKIDRLIAAIRREIDLLREYRTRLISDVVTGKLDVRGAAIPEYEAAEEAAEATDVDTEETEGEGNEE